MSRMGTGGNQVPVIHGTEGETEYKAVDCRNACEYEVNGSLQASCEHNLNSNNVVRTDMCIRRLTPLECERLMGLPDNYTNVPFNGKAAPDSRRYKAIGNGMAVTVSDYVLSCIVRGVEKENEQSEMVGRMARY